MKTKQLITLATVAVAIFTGIVFSSSTTPQANENIPRYHMFYPAATGSKMFVYDAVTGNYKRVSFNDLKNGKNIKELLVN